MTLRNQLLENPLLEYRNDIFYQRGLQRNNPFEASYLRLREKENRIHSDEIVKKLPECDNDHPNKREWEMRKSTLNKLIKGLKASNACSLLELGCGNGWLSHNLAISLNAQICAVDVNELELQQGARVFKEQDNLSFVYTDIFSEVFRKQKFDAIILGSSVQYFPDLESLFTILFKLIDSSGAVFIVDSPFYNSQADSLAAKERSVRHFTSLGFPEMANQYFHHTFHDLNRLNYTMIYDPKSIVSIIKRKLLKLPLSIFPIICIQK